MLGYFTNDVVVGLATVAIVALDVVVVVLVVDVVVVVVVVVAVVVDVLIFLLPLLISNHPQHNLAHLNKEWQSYKKRKASKENNITENLQLDK